MTEPMDVDEPEPHDPFEGHVPGIGESSMSTDEPFVKDNFTDGKEYIITTDDPIDIIRESIDIIREGDIQNILISGISWDGRRNPKNKKLQVPPFVLLRRNGMIHFFNEEVNVYDGMNPLSIFIPDALAQNTPPAIQEFIGGVSEIHEFIDRPPTSTRERKTDMNELFKLYLQYKHVTSGPPNYINDLNEKITYGFNYWTVQRFEISDVIITPVHINLFKAKPDTLNIISLEDRLDANISNTLDRVKSKLRQFSELSKKWIILKNILVSEKFHVPLKSDHEDSRFYDNRKPVNLTYYPYLLRAMTTYRDTLLAQVSQNPERTDFISDLNKLVLFNMRPFDDRLREFNIPIRNFTDLERNTEAVKIPLHELKLLTKSLNDDRKKLLQLTQ